METRRVALQSIRERVNVVRLAPRRRINDPCSHVLQQSLEFGRVHDDRPRRGAQAIDGLGGQYERRRLFIQIGQFRLVLQRRERHVDGIDRGVRNAQSGGHRRILVGCKRSRVADQPRRLPLRRRVFQQFDRLVGKGVDRGARRFEQDVHRTGRALRLVPFRRRRRQRIDDEHNDPAHVVEHRRQTRFVQGFEHFQRIEHTAHAHVVGYAAVDQVQIGPMDAVAVGLHVLQRPNRARGGSRRVVVVDEQLHPGGRTPVAGAAVVLDGDGREHDRHRRRGRSGTRQRHGIEIRADDVERALVEDETRAGRDVGGRRQDHRALAAVEIAEGGAVEQDFVVQLRRQFGPTPALRRQVSPVARTEGAGDDLALHVALQEALLVVVEQLVAVEAVGQRREAAAGNAGDDIDRRAGEPWRRSVRRSRYAGGTPGPRTKTRPHACRRPRRRG